MKWNMSGSCCMAIGQLAQYFIRNFQSLESSKRLIIAPEGFHKFYLQGTGGRVGANWMTKEHRLRDIDDYCSYLNQLVEQVAQTMNAKVHIFGFSQGVATAFRWANTYTLNNLDSLHGWAGTFPPDIDYTLSRQRFNALNLSLHFGDDDEYISLEAARKNVETAGGNEDRNTGELLQGRT